MTAALDAIRARHFDHNPTGALHFCDRDMEEWPCDAAQLLAALDRAEAVVAAADKVARRPGANYFRDDWERLCAALRAYEDADKVADG